MHKENIAPSFNRIDTTNFSNDHAFLGLNPMRFPWLKPRAIFEKTYAKKNIACGFNRRNTTDIDNNY